MRPPNLGALIPLHSHPSKSVQDGLQCLLAMTLLIGIIDAQQELTAVAPSKQPIENRRAHTANMQVTGRARSKSRPYGHASSPRENVSPGPSVCHEPGTLRNTNLRESRGNTLPELHGRA